MLYKKKRRTAFVEYKVVVSFSMQEWMSEYTLFSSRLTGTGENKLQGCQTAAGVVERERQTQRGREVGTEVTDEVQVPMDEWQAQSESEI